jgi:hypothetical protein
MAERPAAVEPDPMALAKTGRDMELALQILRSRRRDPRRTPAEREAISEDQAHALKSVIDAVLDGIGLSDEQRDLAITIAVTELRRVAGENA